MHFINYLQVTQLAICICKSHNHQYLFASHTIIFASHTIIFASHTIIFTSHTIFNWIIARLFSVKVGWIARWGKIHHVLHWRPMHVAMAARHWVHKPGKQQHHPFLSSVFPLCSPLLHFHLELPHTLFPLSSTFISSSKNFCDRLHHSFIIVFTLQTCME